MREKFFGISNLKNRADAEDALTAETRSVYLPYQIKDDRTLEAVLRLPVLYRNPIYLFYYEDYSIQEIAGVLNEKEGTIKTRLRRRRDDQRSIRHSNSNGYPSFLFFSDRVSVSIMQKSLSFNTSFISSRTVLKSDI